MGKKICAQCGNSIDEQAKFCPFCGGMQNVQYDRQYNDAGVSETQPLNGQNAQAGGQYTQAGGQNMQTGGQYSGTGAPYSGQYSDTGGQYSDTGAPYSGQYNDGSGQNAPYGTQEQAAKKSPLVIVLVAVLGGLLLILIICIVVMFGSLGIGSGDSDANDSAVTNDDDEDDADDADDAADTVYTTYTNSTACYSLDYPEGYICQETDDAGTNVLICEDQDADMQVQVQYVYSNGANAAVYCAADFNAQIAADNSVLANWLGASDAQVSALSTESIAGLACSSWAISYSVDGEAYTGEVYITDAYGDYGCYVLFWAVNTEDDDASLYETQCRTMADTLQITGKYQYSGYNLEEVEDSDYDNDLLCLVDGSITGYTEISSTGWHLYPVDGIYGDAKLWLRQGGSADRFDSITEEIEYWLDSVGSGMDNVTVISEAGSIDLGRYDTTGAAVAYSDDGTAFNCYVYVIEIGDVHYILEAFMTEEYYDEVTACVYDFLFSLADADEAETGTYSGKSGSSSSSGSSDSSNSSGSSDSSSSSDSSGSSDSSDSVREASPTMVETDYYSIIFATELYGLYDYEIIDASSSDSQEGYTLYVTHPDSEAAGVGGWLFSIALYSDSGYTELPAYEVLGTLKTGSGAYTVVAILPTDVEYTADTEAGYREIYDQRESIFSGITAADGCTYTEK